MKNLRRRNVVLFAAAPSAMVAALALVACAEAPPPRRAVAMETLPDAGPDKPQRLLVVTDGYLDVLVDGPVIATVDDVSLVHIHAGDGRITILGVKAGVTSLQLRSKDARVDTVELEVKAGTPKQRALGVGDTIVVPAKGIKEYASSGAGIFDVVPTSDGTQFVITGRKAGTSAVTFIHTDGSTESLSLTVIGGNRYF